MNVSLKNLDAVRAILKIEVEKNDYEEQVNKNLRKLRQKMNMPGFRQGMVPFGIAKKIYGKQTLVEEINKIVLENLESYMRDNKVNILGDPIPNETEQKMMDFETDENFEFCFDIALAPVMDVQFSKEDTLKSYKIVINDAEVEKKIDFYRRNYGGHEKTDQAQVEDTLQGDLVELEEGTPKTAGIFIKNTPLILSSLKGKMEQKKFINAKVGDNIVFNPYKAYKGVTSELVTFLDVDKEAVKEMKSDFSFKIHEITRYKPAALNQELFDKILGTDAVKSEAEFRDVIRESLTYQYFMEVTFKRKKEFRNLMLKKVSHIALADDILKRLMLASNKKMTEEKIEKEFPQLMDDLKYSLIKEELVKRFEITVNNEDIESKAKSIIKLQYAQYGILFMPAETMERQVKDMLKKKETVNGLADRIIDDKLCDSLYELVTIDEQEVTIDEYMKLLEE